MTIGLPHYQRQRRQGLVWMLLLPFTGATRPESHDAAPESTGTGHALRVGTSLPVRYTPAPSHPEPAWPRSSTTISISSPT